MVRERKYYSISKALIKNAISAMFSAIELYNKPNLEYRNETVVILLSHAWEILLKGILYKNKNKSVKSYIQESLKNEDTNDIVGLLKVTELYCTGKDRTLLKEHLSFLRKTRNKVMHAYMFPKEVESTLWGLFQKSYELFDEIIENEFKELKISFNFPFILPIGLKKPYDKNSFLSGLGKKEIPLLNDLFESSIKLANENIEDTIIVPIIFSYDKSAKISNADLVFAIDSKEGKKVSFSKEIKLAQNATTLNSPIPVSELKKVFIYSPSEIMKNFGIRKKCYPKRLPIYQEISNEKNFQTFWWKNPENSKKFFSKEGINELENRIRETEK